MKKIIYKAKKRSNDGFALMEAILAIALFSLVITTFAGALIYSQQNSHVVGNTSRATFLAEEGLEAARNLRDEDFSNLSAGTHGLTISGGVWHFQDDPDNTDIFQRALEISAVDENTMEIVSSVSWNGLFGEPHEVSLASYLTNRQAPSP